MKKGRVRARPLFVCSALARRPVHLAPAEDVQMQVIHGLAAFRTSVYDHAETSGQRLFRRYLSSDAHQVAEQRFVLFHGVRLRLDVLLRHDEQVHWSNRLDVAEGDALLVFIEFLCRDFAGGDAAKDTFAHG